MARIRHIAILTDQKEKLVAYYTTVFGLHVVEGVGTATYLSDGHVNLAIIPKEPEEKVEGKALENGINHIGFEVERVADLVSVSRAKGGAADIAKRPPNREAEYRLQDPDGNLIDLSQHGWPI